MAFKKFCDLCDKEIADDAQTFRISGDSNSRDERDVYASADMRISGTWTPKEYTHPMLCQSCYITVRTIVAQLAGKLPN